MEYEKKIQIAKEVGSWVVGIGVTAIVGGIVKSNTGKSTNVITKLCIGVTTFIIGSMVIDKVTNYTDGKIEEAAFCIKKIVDSMPATVEEV